MKTALNNYLAEEGLRDGQTVILRAIRPEDKQMLQEEMHHLSRNSLYFRFFTPKRELTSKELIYFTEIDFSHHVGLLASVVEDGNEVAAGDGRYIVSKDSKSAELAFAVDENYQGKGIATLLLKHLTEIARDAGIAEFTALVLPENEKMLDVFRHCGLPMTESLNVAGVMEISLRLRSP